MGDTCLFKAVWLVEITDPVQRKQNYTPHNAPVLECRGLQGQLATLKMQTDSRMGMWLYMLEILTYMIQSKWLFEVLDLMLGLSLGDSY